MSNEDTELLRKINDKLEFLARSKASQIMGAEFDGAKERQVYELTGKVPRAEISKKAKASATTISSLQQRLASKGLLKKEGKSYRKVFD